MYRLQIFINTKNSMPKYSLIFTLVVFSILISCKPFTDKEKPGIKTALNLELSGQAYLFAPDLDTANCTVKGECDCCSSHILFVNDSNFIAIFYCVADEQIQKGTYNIKEDKIYLQYDTIEVNKNYNWDFETDTSGEAISEYIITMQKINPRQTTLNAYPCKNHIYFKIKDIETAFGTLDKNETAATLIKKLKNGGVYEKLL